MLQSEQSSHPPPLHGINVEQALKILQPDGILSRLLQGFESRDPQQKMMRDIIEAYNRSAITLIEAGTGTGKSLAYLIPAMLWAHQYNERTLISTNTIALQEQLIHKDIPFLTKALNLGVKAALIKGMSNYLCLRKLSEVREEFLLLPPDETKEIEKIEEWSSKTNDGSRSDLSFAITPQTWERVCAESDTCNHKQCPHFDDCFFFKARRKASDAQILVVNHHLLFTDLAYRSDTDPKRTGVLPNYTKVILDEAHHVEDVATEHLSMRLSQLGILRTLGILASEKQGKLTQLKEKLDKYFRKDTPKAVTGILSRMIIDLPGMRRDLLTQIANTFDTYMEFARSLQIRSGFQEDSVSGEIKLRVLSAHHNHPDWVSRVVPNTKQLIDSLTHYIQSLNSLENELRLLKDERLEEQTKSLRFDITAFATRLTKACEVLKSFIGAAPDTSAVRWIEVQSMRTGLNVNLVITELDIAPRLATSLFNPFSTIVLCSATLATNQQFDFIRKRLGLVKELLKPVDVSEHIYSSPFNFQQQALLAIPTDMPYPNSPDFIRAASENIWQAIQASRGNAFVLFTSYTMLRTCYQYLAERMAQHRYPALKQGDENRHSLLRKFRDTDRSVLFGTDSFWEGVDVVGDALRCVIIVKLPFKVPSEPIVQARSEAITAKGGDPFMEYSLPNAIVKFKQGFGRLIRNKRDRGCIVCLDTRLVTKDYGRQFLNSLPVCQQLIAPSTMLHQQMSEFYRKTHYLVKS